MNANLYTLFEQHFPDEGSQPCVLVPGGTAVSYDELARMSAQIAHALCAAGCVPGDRVAVQTDKHWQVLALYLATLRAGLVYLPLNTGYQRAELAFFFADATPRVIVCGAQMLGVVATLARDATVLTLDAHGGELLDRAAAHPETFATVARGTGRPRRHPLHQRHDRALERRDAVASQPREQRADAGRGVAVQPRRRVAARVARLPRARAVRRRALRAAGRRTHARGSRASTPTRWRGSCLTRR